jgi:hypothetical protein
MFISDLTFFRVPKLLRMNSHELNSQALAEDCVPKESPRLALENFLDIRCFKRNKGRTRRYDRHPSHNRRSQDVANNSPEFAPHENARGQNEQKENPRLDIEEFDLMARLPDSTPTSQDAISDSQRVVHGCLPVES